MSYYEDKKTYAEIIDICKLLHQHLWLAACDGNVSVRLERDRIMITPSGVPKAFLALGSECIVLLDGTVVKGKPSSEVDMHLAVYQNCSDAQAVVHAHPPVSTAWSIAHPELKELPSECISELILAVGSVPIVPYARPGSKEMGTNLLPYLPSHRAMILAHHGAICWGESLMEAYSGIERVEHASRVLSEAHRIGQLHALPEKEIQFLKEKRLQLGDKIL